MRQSDLAAAISRSVNFLSEIERGETNFSVELLAELAFALGLDAADLVAGIVPSPRGPRPWLERLPKPPTHHAEEG